MFKKAACTVTEAWLVLTNEERGNDQRGKAIAVNYGINREMFSIRSFVVKNHAVDSDRCKKRAESKLHTQYSDKDRAVKR